MFEDGIAIIKYKANVSVRNKWVFPRGLIYYEAVDPRGVEYGLYW